MKIDWFNRSRFVSRVENDPQQHHTLLRVCYPGFQHLTTDHYEGKKKKKKEEISNCFLLHLAFKSVPIIDDIMLLE